MNAPDAVAVAAPPAAVAPVTPKFRYGGDPVFLAACAAYAVLRWGVRPWWTAQGWPLAGQLTDWLLIPAALPPMLWLQRRFGWRADDAMPSAGEILLHLVVWSVLAEVVMPLWWGIGVADAGDVAAYAFGALLAWGAWRPRPHGPITPERSRSAA